MELLLSVLSALARLDVDPWKEAANLAQLPEETAALFHTVRMLWIHQERGLGARGTHPQFADRLQLASRPAFGRLERDNLATGNGRATAKTPSRMC
jgi:hypothetical protein